MIDLQREYNKQRKRALAAQRRLKKQGFIFIENQIPPKPKKVTQASVNRLKKITPDYLRNKAKSRIDPDTGEPIPKFTKKKRKKSAQKTPKAPTIEVPETQVSIRLPNVSRETSTDKPLWEDIIIANVRAIIAQHPDSAIAKKFDVFINEQLASEGKYAVAVAFVETQKYDDIQIIIADSDGKRLQAYFNEFTSNFPPSESSVELMDMISNYDEWDEID